MNFLKNNFKTINMKRFIIFPLLSISFGIPAMDVDMNSTPQQTYQTTATALLSDATTYMSVIPRDIQQLITQKIELMDKIKNIIDTSDLKAALENTKDFYNSSSNLIAEFLSKKFMKSQLNEALGYAILDQNLACAEILLKAGADPDYPRQLITGTLIHRAIMFQNIPFVKLLLDYGATTDNFKFQGISTLSLAVQTGNDSLVTYLLDRGLNPNITDARGWTPLFRAAIGNYADIAEILILRKANIDTKDPYGKTALDIAQEKGHIEVFNIIEQFKSKE